VPYSGPEKIACVMMMTTTTIIHTMVMFTAASLIRSAVSVYNRLELDCKTDLDDEGVS
jgi:hypothetical protein